MGDVFTDVHGSVIATRGSIAKGIISVREQGHPDIAQAISDLDGLIAEAPDTLLPAEKKKESTELLDGITQEAGKPEPNKSILRSLGNSFLAILTSIGPLAEAGKNALDTIKQLWS